MGENRSGPATVAAADPDSVADRATTVVRPTHVGRSGTIIAPAHPKGLVIFAAGGGDDPVGVLESQVADTLNRIGLAVLIQPLLTERELTASAREDEAALVKSLALRLISVSEWARGDETWGELPLGLLGVRIGATAALMAAGDLRDHVGAVVAEGRRPDRAGRELATVTAPTLLIVGELDWPGPDTVADAYHMMQCHREFREIPGVRDPFGENGALDEVLSAAAAWFAEQLLKEA